MKYEQKAFLRGRPDAEETELQAALKTNPVLRVDYPEKGLKVWVVGDPEIINIAARRLTVNAEDCVKFIKTNGKLPKREIDGMQKRHGELMASRAK